MRSVIFLVAVSACSVPAEHSSSQDIIGGTRATGMTATVLLASFPPDRSNLFTCSAALISPTVVLTSAHCVDTPNHHGFIFGVFAGDDASQYATLAALEPHLAPVASVQAHPAYVTTTPFYADLGVAVLAQPLAGVTPLPLQRTPLDTSIIGKPAEIVGYGQTIYQQPNQSRYHAMTTVTAIEDDTIVVGNASIHGCLGDSGGPAIVGGNVVGIDSYGPTGCTGASHYRRVDAFLPFIDQFVPPPSMGADAGPSSSPEAGAGGGDDDGGGGGSGCSAGGGTGLAFGLLAAASLRRRRTRAAR